jgi:hypothetical protein
VTVVNVAASSQRHSTERCIVLSPVPKGYPGGPTAGTLFAQQGVPLGLAQFTARDDSLRVRSKKGVLKYSYLTISTGKFAGVAKGGTPPVTLDVST